MELIDDNPVTILMTVTVPIGFQFCNDLSFLYSHIVAGVAKSDCQTFFKESRLQHSITVSSVPTPGCSSYKSLVRFLAYSKPGGAMWTNYSPSNITV